MALDLARLRPGKRPAVGERTRADDAAELLAHDGGRREATFPGDALDGKPGRLQHHMRPPDAAASAPPRPSAPPPHPAGVGPTAARKRRLGVRPLTAPFRPIAGSGKD